jgi:hypothetical protein
MAVHICVFPSRDKNHPLFNPPLFITLLIPV